MTSTTNAIISQIVLLPTSLLLLMAAGCLLLAVRWRRSGWTLLLVGIGGLGVLSMPFTAQKMMHTLEQRSPVEPGLLAQAQAIVVLGGGIDPSQPEYAADTANSASLARIRYAAFLYRQHELPILVTGGNSTGGEADGWVMKRELETLFDVPVHWVETKSVNTAENAEFSWEILGPEGVHTIALLTQAWHMPRARQAFERAGFTVVPAPTVFHVEPVQGIMNFIPQADYLSMANTAIHEWVGMLWYRMTDGGRPASARPG
ncbi:MAG: YdcF family protein [Pollutimonas bauzanensis]|uniref:Uncharacterized SAM-binding protein YcdF, DUF218 family n=1 Tax=Pollutimonas bauzanensis TaxID=658167 RepID=A0A1M5UP92_9BURK|nr:YdcF family protein [Pollutimonas bauzanensis]SHH64760.1 Uncharacterized SAM-binding protein YcdF, DUF218 family [Pollutimonas bauzanensis]